MRFTTAAGALGEALGALCEAQMLELAAADGHGAFESMLMLMALPDGLQDEVAELVREAGQPHPRASLLLSMPPSLQQDAGLPDTAMGFMLDL